MVDYFVVAGGTGGHVFPALAIAKSLQNAGSSVQMITDNRGEKLIKDMPYNRIAAKAVLGRGPVQRIRALMALGWGYLQSHRLLWRHKPHTVVGFGGYAALPMVLAAQHQGRRTVIHEQNAVMGRVNRLLARKADHVALAFAETRSCPKNAPQSFVGNPAAGLKIQLQDKNTHAQQFKLLVLGGSLGAQIFDRLIIEAMAIISEETRQKISVIQQTVSIDPADLQAEYAALGVQAQCARFIQDVAQIMPQQSMIITRAGGGITAEVSNAGLPALYVPLPIAADQHQYYNALYYAEAGGAEIIAQPELTPELLAEKLHRYSSDHDALSAMSQAMLKCAMPEALARLQVLLESR